MCKAALRRRYQQLSTIRTCGLIWSWMTTFGAPFFVTVLGFASVLHADPVEPPTLMSPYACQEQFLLDRRDQPQLALQKLQQCNVSHDASTSLEEFTLWYITLPPKAAPQQNSWFLNVWRNKLRVLTSPPIGLSNHDAISVLDEGVVRALKKGKRDDLSAEWLASHDTTIIEPPASSKPRDQTHDVQVNQAHEPATPGSRHHELPKKLSAYQAAARLNLAHPSRPSGRYQSQTTYESAEELNRARAANSASSSVRAFYDAPTSYSSGVQPQPYLARSTQQVPSSTIQQQPYEPSAPQQPATVQQQASYGANVQQASYLPLPLQIEANVRMILQQVTTNIQSFEQAVSRQLRGY